MGTSHKASAPPIIRLAHPLAFAAFLRHIGAPVDKHLRRQGLPALCENPDEFVPLSKAWSFFHATAQSEDPMLGWHVGRFVGDHNLNRGLLRKLEHAPTLYQALQLFVRLVSAEASHLQLGIRQRRDDIVFFTQYSDIKGVPGYTGSQGYQLGVFVDLIRHFAGKHWVPDEIGVEYPVVPDVAKEHFPGTRFLARQRVGYIAVPRSCLHLAVRRDDSEDVGEDSLLLTDSFGYVDTLRALLKPYLAGGYPSAQLAASLMDTSPRTLARRLATSGVTYRAVVDGLRFDSARELLENGDEKIGHVASAVGFNDPAHFARMFRRVGGLSPREFRKASR